jgi:hypothetical protein
MRLPPLATALGVTLFLLFGHDATPLAQSLAGVVDTALVLSVDVSGSVDDNRYVLQMEGIAAAFDDPAVQSTILSGPHRAMLVALVNWSNKPQIAIPWTVIASAADAHEFAARVRRAPRMAEDFTCMSAMMQLVAGKLLPLMPMPAERTVVDVSGDGHDNCNPTMSVDSQRDALVDTGVIINGLPIREGNEAATIEGWYQAHVIGGAGAFLLPADGYKDFGRAIRRKFIIEISGGRTPRAPPG